MTKKLPLFNVTVKASGVRIEKVLPANSDYAKASQNMILRHRDAIVHFKNKSASSRRFTGTYSFQHIDTARTFAMLYLERMQQDVEDNIDRILAYAVSETLPKKKQL